MKGDPVAELTKNQRLVFTALSAAGTPLSAYQLLDALRGDGFRAPLQVYRALDQLRGAGLVHRLESMNAFVACSHVHDGHRHDDHDHAHAPVAFAICRQCGAVAELADAAMEKSLGKLCAGTGFKAEKATIEISGLCPACAP
jgi:Fur family zinc uptake transcriptional regulator